MILRAFWREGYDNVTISQLVKETGVTAPSLYAVFGDKASMFKLASARYIDRLDAALTRDLNVASAHDALENVLTAAAQGFTRAGQPAGCLVMAEPLLAERRAVTRQAIRARLQAGYDNSEINEDPDAVSDFVDTVLAGMAARARDGADQTELNNAARRALKALQSA